jgi:hypothetical protein
MGYPANVVRLTHHYELGAGASHGLEQAEWGVWMQAPADLEEQWQESVEFVVEQASDHAADLQGEIGGLLPDGTAITGVTARHVAADGSTLHMARHGVIADAGTGGTSLPYEVARCISLYSYDPGTFVPDGRRRRNRFFLPPESVSSMGENGLYDNDSTNLVAIAVDAYLEALQGTHVVAGAGVVAFYRLATVSQVGAGRADQVEYSAVGHVPDSQRRRRAKLPEGRVYSALAHS